ncbi:MAG: hypothetical protein EBS96_03410 [Spartobacteria bacterium]|nr:hypothetical protein [Spartobacteria bacterium]
MPPHSNIKRIQYQTHRSRIIQIKSTNFRLKLIKSANWSIASVFDDDGGIDDLRISRGSEGLGFYETESLCGVFFGWLKVL